MRTALATVLGIVLLVSVARSGEPARRPDPDSPVGTWKNAYGAELKITEKRLYWSLPYRQPGVPGSVPTTVKKFDADYAPLRNGIIVGYVTNVEGGPPPAEETPFSFRCRVDDGFLTIKEMKGKGFENEVGPGNVAVAGLAVQLMGKYTREEQAPAKKGS